MTDELTNINTRLSRIEGQLKTLYAIKILTDDNIQELESEIYDLELNKLKLI